MRCTCMSHHGDSLRALSPLPYSIQKLAGISVAQNNNFQHVTLVDPHGIAAEAGILAGDEIVHAQLNGDELILRMKRNASPPRHQ